MHDIHEFRLVDRGRLLKWQIHVPVFPAAHSSPPKRQSALKINREKWIHDCLVCRLFLCPSSLTFRRHCMKRRMRLYVGGGKKHGIVLCVTVWTKLIPGRNRIRRRRSSKGETRGDTSRSCRTDRWPSCFQIRTSVLQFKQFFTVNAENVCLETDVRAAVFVLYFSRLNSVPF